MLFSLVGCVEAIAREAKIRNAQRSKRVKQFRKAPGLGRLMIRLLIEGRSVRFEFGMVCPESGADRTVD